MVFEALYIKLFVNVSKNKKEQMCVFRACPRNGQEEEYHPEDLYAYEFER